MSLKVSNFSYQVGHNLLLDMPDFAFDPGKIHGVKGPSGAGKSTLLYCLAGIDAAAGRLWLDGRLVLRDDEKSRDRFRRENIGLVFQNIHLLPGLTILENVLLPVSFSQWQPSKQQKAYAKKLLSDFGFGRVTDKTDFLSRGEKQRIAIARALVMNPRVLLADEPTASLDSENSQRVIELLRRCADEQKIVVVASHDPLVLAAADSVICLERGRPV